MIINFDEQASLVESDPSEKTNFGTVSYYFIWLTGYPLNMLEDFVPFEMALVLQKLNSQGHTS